MRILSVNLALTFLLCGAVYFGYHLYRGSTLSTPPPSGPGMWQEDARYGFRHIVAEPGKTLTYKGEVTYSIDDRGFRVTPNPVESRGDILLLGCSWTFGDGVNDEEAYPYLLARDYWPGFKIRNAASMAWGTTQAWLALDEALTSKTPPVLVLYGWIDDHLRRNYLADVWLDTLAPYERKIPHFELFDGKPHFKGVVGAEAGLHRDLALREKELELTYHLILEMHERCRTLEVPFYLVDLPTAQLDEAVSKPLYDRLNLAGVKVIDLTEGVTSGDFMDGVGHPSPSGHQRFAEALGQNPDLLGCLKRVGEQ